MGKFLRFAALLAGLATVPCQAAKLEGIDLAADGVVIRTSAPVRFKDFLLPDPPRLVLELEDTQTAKPLSAAGKGKLLTGARAAQFSRAPDVVRVVLDLSAPAKYQAEAKGNSLAVSLVEPPAAPAPAPRAVQRIPQVDDAAENLLKLSALDKALLSGCGVLVAALLAAGLVWRKRPAKTSSLGALNLEDSGEMIEGIQQNLNALARRISILEKQVGHLGSSPSAGSSSSAKAEEELRAMKTVLKSLVKALKIPADF